MSLLAQPFVSYCNLDLPCVLVMGDESPQRRTIGELIGVADNAYPRTVEAVYQEIAEQFDLQGYYEFDVGFDAMSCRLYWVNDFGQSLRLDQYLSSRTEYDRKSI